MPKKVNSILAKLKKIKPGESPQEIVDPRNTGRGARGAGKRRYTDEEKVLSLISLDLNNGNLLGTANQLGIPEQTLREWNSGRLHPSLREIREGRTLLKPLADRCEDGAHYVAGFMLDPLKLHSAPLNHVSVAFGVLVDKMRLLRDLPTSISQRNDPNDPELQKLKEVLRAARERKKAEQAGLPVPSPSPTTPPSLPAPSPGQENPTVLTVQDAPVPSVPVCEGNGESPANP